MECIVETNVVVDVRWWDGYLETFQAEEARHGCDLLWIRLTNGTNRNIPLRHVRWFSLSKESHGSDTNKATLKTPNSFSESSKSNACLNCGLPFRSFCSDCAEIP